MADDLTPLFQDQAIAAGEAVKSILSKLKITGLAADYAAATAAALVAVVGVALSTALAFYVKVATPLAVALLQTLGKAREEIGTGINPLLTSALGEMLGTDVSPDALPTGQSTTDTTKRMQVLGDIIYKQLLTEFVPQGGVTPESGEVAAKAFAGFGANFAITNSYISILAELVSDDKLEQWREIGVELANNLGLGRLQRHALGVLFTHIIEKPYTDQLAARYRPNHLSESQIVRAFGSGDYDDATTTLQLSYKGYTDRDIAILRSQLAQHLNVQETETLSEWFSASSFAGPTPDGATGWNLGDATPLSKDDAIEQLRSDGLDEATARRRLLAQALQRANAAVARYADHIERLAVQGLMDTDTARNLLSEIPMGDVERAVRIKSIGLQLEFPANRPLTFAELETAYIQGVITESEVEAGLRAHRYSENDILTLVSLILIKASQPPKKKATTTKTAG